MVWLLSGCIVLKSRFVNRKSYSAGFLADLEHRKRADGPDTVIFALIIDPDLNFERALSW
jgi:hypothetical protein